MNNTGEVLTNGNIRNEDLFKKEVQAKAGNIGACVGVIMAAVFSLFK